MFQKHGVLRFAIENQEQLVFFIIIGKTRTTAGKAVLGRALADGHECSYAAEMYSLFGACKVLGKNPKKWLAYVLDHIKGTKPQDMHKLLPSEWEEC